MFTTADLFGPFHTTKGPLHRAHRQASALPPHKLEPLFGSCLPAGLLSQTDRGPNSRQRVFSLRVTFWAFLWQCLNPGSSCKECVKNLIAWFSQLGRPKPSTDDSPYCQARHRLGLDTLRRALKASAQAAEQRAGSQGRFHDREVLVGDGTASTAPDTQANQRAFPQSRRALPGCGFPLVRWVGILSLASGALLAVAHGNKHQAELKLFRKIWDVLKAGMIFLADRAFCDFVTLVVLWLRGVDSVLRLNASRSEDMRQGKRLGRYDRLVTWHKPLRKPRTASLILWLSLPAEITLRLIRYPVCIAGYRPRYIILVTTLLDPKAYPAAELAQLYLRRWGIELFLRDIKTTLGMDLLTCKTPAMLYRELLMHLIAYNCIRMLMVEAAVIYQVNLDRISFTGSLDAVRHFSPVIAQARGRHRQTQLLDDLLRVVASDLVPLRPHRVEPRVQKRRRKAYPYMTKPRAELKAKLLRGKNTQNERA